MTKQPTTLFIARHGETLWNVERRLQGHLDSELSERGREQARQLAFCLRQFAPAALYTSDLGRTLATAQAIADVCALTPRPDRRLRERHLGVFQGFTAAEIRLTHPREWQEFQRRDPDFVIPGGESARQRAERTLEGLRDIARHHAGECIVVVGHSGTLDSIYRACTGLELGDRRKLTISNGSLNTVEYRHESWHLVKWSDTEHLDRIVSP